MGLPTVLGAVRGRSGPMLVRVVVSLCWKLSLF